MGVITNPFGYFNNGVEVCIPDLNSKPSYKVQTKVRGTFSVGTGGFGFVAVNPLYHCNDQFAISFTNNTFAGLLVAPGAVGTALQSNQQMPFPGANARFSRLVGAGLRIRYIGKELDRSGIQVGAIENSNLNTSLGNRTFGELASRPDNSSTTPVSRGWHTIAWRPADEEQREWHFDHTATPYASITIDNVKMVFGVEGTTGNRYEYEFINFVEFASSFNNLVPGVTASHSDTDGMSAISNFVGTLWNSEPGQSLYNRGVNYVYNYLAGASASVLESLTTSSAAPLLLTF